MVRTDWSAGVAACLGVLVAGPDGEVGIDAERAGALLTLTAIHDIYKVWLKSDVPLEGWAPLIGS